MTSVHTGYLRPIIFVPHYFVCKFVQLIFRSVTPGAVYVASNSYVAQRRMTVKEISLEVMSVRTKSHVVNAA
jgi:hypothetical protein